MKDLEEKTNMNINYSINIDDYLTEEEKKEIAIDYFREALKNTSPIKIMGKQILKEIDILAIYIIALFLRKCKNICQIFKIL